MITSDISIYSLLTVGFMLGMAHALDADHVAAVSTFAVNTKSVKSALQLGARWGVGHTFALMVIGFVILLFHIELPHSFESISEGIIGAVLIALGVKLIDKVKREKWHLHKHIHSNGTSHAHLHEHAHSLSHTHNHRPLLIGILHGTAGSAAITLFILTTIDRISVGMIYIAIFGIGSILGMMIISLLLSAPLLIISKQHRFITAIQSFAGIASIFIGGKIIIEIVASLIV